VAGSNSHKHGSDQKLRRFSLKRLGRIFRRGLLSSLTRRIIFLNMAGLAVLVTGILYLNQFREGLIDARVESLRTQAAIIAGAIASQASVETGAITLDPELLLELEAGESYGPSFDTLSALENGIDAEKVAPFIKRLTSETRTRARIFDSDAILLLDSDNIYSSGQVEQRALPNLTPAEPNLWQRTKNLFWGSEPLIEDNFEIGSLDGETFDEVSNALTGSATVSLSKNREGGSIVSVAVPIQRFRAVLGVLLLSTQGSDIDEIVTSERWAIGRVPAAC